LCRPGRPGPGCHPAGRIPSHRACSCPVRAAPDRLLVRRQPFGRSDGPPVDFPVFELFPGVADQAQVIVVGLDDRSGRVGNDDADDVGIGKPPEPLVEPEAVPPQPSGVSDAPRPRSRPQHGRHQPVEPCLSTKSVAPRSTQSTALSSPSVPEIRMKGHRLFHPSQFQGCHAIVVGKTKVERITSKRVCASAASYSARPLATRSFAGQARGLLQLVPHSSASRGLSSR